MRLTLIALGLSFVLGGCKEEKKAAPDAAITNPKIVDEASGLTLDVPTGWDQTNPPPSEGDIRTIARLVRNPMGRRFMVAPRLVITEEPTEISDPQLLFKITMAQLRSIGEKPNVELTSTSMGARTVSGYLAGDLEIAYEVKDPTGRSKEVTQRSLVIFKLGTPNKAITLSASYMSKDVEHVGAQIQQMFVSVKLK